MGHEPRTIEATEVTAEQTLHIDVPVKLKEAKVVYNIDHLMLWGDMPFAIAHLGAASDHGSV